jgi:hypothetical protein
VIALGKLASWSLLLAVWTGVGFAVGPLVGRALKRAGEGSSPVWNDDDEAYFDDTGYLADGDRSDV